MSNLVSKFTASEISATVAAVSLPAALQGITEWAGSSAIGGNTAAHLASVNGKAQAIGICQLFGDWWFGSESLPNILKGIKNGKVRKAFDMACADVVRNGRRAITADDMLSFLRGFTFAALSAEKIDADKLLADTSKADSKADSKPTDTSKADTSKADTSKADALPTVEAQQAQSELLQAQAMTIASLQAEVEALRQSISEQRTRIVAARTLKEVKEMVA